jgi:creatinine amidohydrolase
VVPSRPGIKQFVWVVVCLVTFAGSFKAFLANAQTEGGATTVNSAGTPKMRTRLMTSLSGYEVADYLKRNDVIFIPVGPTELNGGNPTDVEYVIPLAYAIKLAEKSDGLVLPYLAFTYPGSTTISPGTVMVTPEEGVAYLKVVTKSLIRQGFRRIIFLTSHGPSGYTVGTLTREIFDETHVPVVWMSTSVIDGSGFGANRGAPARPGAPTGGRPAQTADPSNGMNARRSLTYGAYLAVGRLEDMPVDFSVAKHEFEADEGGAEVERHLAPGQSDYGRFYADPSQHGGWPTAITAGQRGELGKQGLALIESQVAAYDIAGLLDGLRKHDSFTKTLEKKYGNLLPPGPARP